MTKLGIIIGITKDGRRGQCHITSPAQEPSPIIEAALKDKAKKLVEQLRKKGQPVNYIHLGLLAEDQQSYDLLDVLEV